MLRDSIQFDQIRNRFVALNRVRIAKTQVLMRARGRPFLDVLPLLWHINHPILPGFSGENVAYGVQGYSPPQEALNAAKLLFSGFELPKRAPLQFDIHSIFLIGSAGSMAFSRDSDFDVWLCYRPTLEPQGIEKLQRKAVEIEKWAATLGLEVHFFVMNAEHFRDGKMLELSKESSGSAQHKLLLDEFYRTSLWVAGRYPLWWFVPPGADDEYDAVQESVSGRDVGGMGECIDFGSLPTIPADEFFGAAVWQVYKGVESPYKSALKITLMEAYASQYPACVPLAAEFKAAVYANVDPNDLDPYLMLLRRLERYLLGRDEGLRLELIRRSFYVKLDLPVTDPNQPDDWRKKSVLSVLAGWGWSAGHRMLMDTRNQWKIGQVIEERKLMVDYLTRSYAFLSKFARDNADALRIKQDELTALGRKLYSAFDRRAGKIEIVNRGIVNDIEEDTLTLVLLRAKEGASRWELYRGKLTPAAVREQAPLKVAHSLVELLVWCYFNQVLAGHTQMLVYPPGVLPVGAIQSVSDRIKQAWPERKLGLPDHEALHQSAQVASSALFINAGAEPAVSIAVVEKEMLSGDVDILKIGSPNAGVVATLDYVYVNSWREVFVHHYAGMDGFAAWLCAWLAVQVDPAASMRPKLPHLSEFSMPFGHSLVTRMKQVIERVAQAFAGSPQTENPIYVFEADKSLYAISRSAEGFTHKHYDRPASFLVGLGHPHACYRPVIVDEHALGHTPLSVIFKNGLAGVIQVFCYAASDVTTVYVLDENGAAISHQIRGVDASGILSHYVRFLKSVSQRRQLILENRGAQANQARTDWLIDAEYWLVRKEKLTFELDRHYPQALKETSHVYSVQATADLVDGQVAFTFFCNDTEFTSQEHGASVFDEVARAIFKQRRGAERYPIYITDLDLSERLLRGAGANPLQTINFLLYKKRIEERLNKALSEL